MRFVRASLFLLAAAAGCGGNVVVDAAGTGAGTTTSSGPTTGSGVTTGTGTDTSSGTVTITTTTVGGTCPAVPPHDGESCSTPGLACPMPLLCCSPTVTCSGGTWHVPPPTCSTPCLPCGQGNQGCSPQAVCVLEPSVGPPPPSPIWDCKPNPCAGQPLTCACAAAVCDGAGCAGIMGQDVICNSLP